MGKKPASVTLQALANELGLHVSTVSRVLNASSETIGKAASPETIARIQSLAERWKYRPNPHAISLRKKRSNFIGVVVPKVSDLVLAIMYEGIEQAASEEGYFTFIFNSYDRADLHRRQIALTLDRRVDGLIIGDATLNAGRDSFHTKLPIPFVLVNRRSDPFPSVTCDDTLGGRLAARHLLALGHTRVAVVTGPKLVSTAVDRTEGFVRAYAEAGYPLPDEAILHCDGFDTLTGRQAAALALARTPRPTALFVVNDFGAIGAMGAARDAGLVPGRDVAIVGFNDIPLAAELPIPLTTVRSPIRTIGYLGMRLLLDLMRGAPVSSRRLEPELVVRASSMPVPKKEDCDVPDLGEQG